jgi:hypothetical protein
MSETRTTHSWSKFLRLFSQQNNGRPTRIGVFEGDAGRMNDYWVEDGLPLLGIDLDPEGRNAPSLEIMLGGADGARHMTHTVSQARFVKIVLSPDGETDGLDIEDGEGKTTILRFENQI